ncbi:MAG TPA: hypothetical protein VLD57_03010, partial [Blastocatellia bacterium]|nr:hypothetical protein [Blastocatellia bacterium]
MKRITVSITLSIFCLMLPSLAAGQEDAEGNAKEVYTGTLVNVSGRMVTVGFTLTLTGRTSNEEAQNYLSILASEGQEGLMKAIRKNDLGYIAATGQTRRNLILVREAQIEGKRRIIAAFERWQGFWELRGGYRSTDYAFSIIEIFFDEKGKGSGTFIGLAQLKLERDKKTEQLQLELESFGSFPAKVMGVMRRK